MATKLKVATKRFILPDGQLSKDVTAECVGIRFDFADEANIEFQFDSAPPENRHMAMARGYAEDLGNTYAGVKGDAEAAFEAVHNRIEQHQSGAWYSDREGPSPVLLLAALAIACEKRGRPFDEAAVREKLKDAGYRAAVMKLSDVDVAYKKLQSDRAAERHAAAEKRAADAGTQDLSII